MAIPTKFSSRIGFIFPENGLEAFIDQQDNSFHSHTAPVVFMDDVIDLHTFVEFKLEIAHPINADSTANVIIDSELMSIDHRNKIQSLSQKLSAFASLGNFKAKARNYHSGITEYLPIIFEGNSFCQVDGIFQMSLTDVRLASPKPLETQRELFKQTAKQLTKRVFESYNEIMGFLYSNKLLEILDVPVLLSSFRFDLEEVICVEQTKDPRRKLIENLLPFFKERNCIFLSMETFKLLQNYITYPMEDTLFSILHNLEEHFFATDDQNKIIEESFFEFIRLILNCLSEILSALVEGGPVLFKRALVILREESKDQLSKKLTESITEKRLPLKDLFKIKKGTVHDNTWDHRNNIFYRSIGFYYKSKVGFF